MIVGGFEHLFLKDTALLIVLVLWYFSVAEYTLIFFTYWIKKWVFQWAPDQSIIIGKTDSLNLMLSQIDWPFASLDCKINPRVMIPELSYNPRRRLYDLSFFDYLSQFFVIEFHCTFSISYTILPDYVYYYCSLIGMW